MGEVIFRERQRFAVVVRLFGLTVAVGVVVVVFVSGDYGAWLGLVVALAAMVHVTLVVLHTEVRPQQLIVRFTWWPKRTVDLSTVRSVSVIRYRRLFLGGRGYRMGWGYRVFNARGRDAVELTLDTGPRLIIGSQRAAELATAIESAGGPATS